MALTVAWRQFAALLVRPPHGADATALDRVLGDELLARVERPLPWSPNGWLRRL